MAAKERVPTAAELVRELEALIRENQRPLARQSGANKFTLTVDKKTVSFTVVAEVKRQRRDKS